MGLEIILRFVNGPDILIKSNSIKLKRTTKIEAIWSCLKIKMLSIIAHYLWIYHCSLYHSRIEPLSLTLNELNVQRTLQILTIDKTVVTYLQLYSEYSDDSDYPKHL